MESTFSTKSVEFSFPYNSWKLFCPQILWNPIFHRIHGNYFQNVDEFMETRFPAVDEFTLRSLTNVGLGHLITQLGHVS